MSSWLPLVGVALGWALNEAGALIRRRRDARARWSDLRRRLVIDLLAAAERIVTWGTTTTNLLRAAEEGGPIITTEGVSDFEEAARRATQADMELQRLHIELQLIGSESEREGAQEVRDAVWALTAAYGAWHTAGAPMKDETRARFEAAYRAYLAARDKLLSVARKGLLAA